MIVVGVTQVGESMLTGSRIESRIVMAVAAFAAVGWVILGFNSNNVPWGSDAFWIAFCGVAAGASVAIAHYQTVFALRSYVVVTAAIGSVRSLAYLSDDSGGPSAVWFILTVTTVGLYLAIVDRLDRRRINGGG